MISEADTVSTLIQSADAPVFLLAGVAGFLNVLTGRGARVMNRLEPMNSYLNAVRKAESDYVEDGKSLEKRAFPVQRLQNINLALHLYTATGLLMGLVILSTFSGELFDVNRGKLISGFFVQGMLILILFLKEIYCTNLSIHTSNEEDETV